MEMKRSKIINKIRFDKFSFDFRKLLSTQFQPTDARKAFPCFDEPQFKARFLINIIHPDTTIALANFPISVCSFPSFLSNQIYFPRTKKHSMIV
jgi:hypothetical protein